MKYVIELWKKHFLPAEFCASLVVGACFAIWVLALDGGVIVDGAIKNNRGAIYSAFASIFGSLLGFVITSISIVLVVAGDSRFALVRGSAHYRTLWDVFTSSVRALAVATIAALFGLIVDRDDAPWRSVQIVVVGTAVLASLRVFRCIWVLELIVKVLINSASIPPAPTPSTASPPQAPSAGS